MKLLQLSAAETAEMAQEGAEEAASVGEVWLGIMIFIIIGCIAIAIISALRLWPLILIGIAVAVVIFIIINGAIILTILSVIVAIAAIIALFVLYFSPKNRMLRLFKKVKSILFKLKKDIITEDNLRKYYQSGTTAIDKMVSITEKHCKVKCIDDIYEDLKWLQEQIVDFCKDPGYNADLKFEMKRIFKDIKSDIKGSF